MRYREYEEYMIRLVISGIEIDRNVKKAVGATTEQLKSIVLPNSIECIQYECFRKSNIRRVFVPKSVKSIGDDAFQNCRNLTSVILQEGLESIGDNCFRKTTIREIAIPKSVKSIR